MRSTFDHIAYAKTFSGGITLLRGTEAACRDYVRDHPTVDGLSTHIRCLRK